MSQNHYLSLTDRFISALYIVWAEYFWELPSLFFALIRSAQALARLKLSLSRHYFARYSVF